MGYASTREHVLRDCTFRLPAGRICGLVGPNGAGKSTLLAIAAGLMRPTDGTVRLLGTTPAAARERVAYVAQHKPLYPQLTVEATLRLGAELNPGRWDQDAAERIAYGGGLDPRAKIRTLSGGLRTRVSLALAFGKRAELLLLDEPMADIDPVARHELSGALMAEAAERDTTIVMSSHVVAELEGACDYLLLLGSGRIRLAGDCDGILAAHRLLTGLRGDFGPYPVVEEYEAGRGRMALVRTDGELPAAAHADEPGAEYDAEYDVDTDAEYDVDTEAEPGDEPGAESAPKSEAGPGDRPEAETHATDEWAVDEPSLEHLLLAYLRNPDVPDLLLPEGLPVGAGSAAHGEVAA
uniref:ABC transporter ATP-binding protein n=1 Tax=Streptomyces winkii TaxID=3051178 RepID=UPI0037D9D09D